MKDCALVFEFEVPTKKFGEEVLVVGSIKELGSWNVERGLHLSQSKGNPLIWHNTTSPIHLFIGEEFEYKIVKKEKFELVWESLEDEVNRYYLVGIEKRVKIKGVFNSTMFYEIALNEENKLRRDILKDQIKLLPFDYSAEGSESSDHSSFEKMELEADDIDFDLKAQKNRHTNVFTSSGESEEEQKGSPTARAPSKNPSKRELKIPDRKLEFLTPMRPAYEEDNSFKYKGKEKPDKYFKQKQDMQIPQSDLKHNGTPSKNFLFYNDENNETNDVKSEKKTGFPDIIPLYSLQKSTALSSIYNQQSILPPIKSVGTSKNTSPRKGQPVNSTNEPISLKGLYMKFLSEGYVEKYPPMKHRNESVHESFEEEGSLVLNDADEILIICENLPIQAEIEDDEVVVNVLHSLENRLALHLFEDCQLNQKHVIWVGQHPKPPTPDKQEKISKYLLQKYNCFPLFNSYANHIVYPNIEKSNDELNQSDHISNASLDSSSDSSPVTPMSRQNLRNKSTILAMKPSVIHGFECAIKSLKKSNAFVIIMDSCLWPLINALAGTSEITVMLYFKNFFPDALDLERAQRLRDLLRAILNLDIICFRSYQHAKNLIDMLELRGIFLKSEKGLLYLSYRGRKIYVKLSSAGLSPKYLQKVRLTPAIQKLMPRMKSLPPENSQNKFKIMSINSDSQMRIISKNIEYFINRRKKSQADQTTQPNPEEIFVQLVITSHKYPSIGNPLDYLREEIEQLNLTSSVIILDLPINSLSVYEHFISSDVFWCYFDKFEEKLIQILEYLFLCEMPDPSVIVHDMNTFNLPERLKNNSFISKLDHLDILYNFIESKAKLQQLIPNNINELKSDIKKNNINIWLEDVLLMGRKASGNLKLSRIIMNKKMEPVRVVPNKFLHELDIDLLTRIIKRCKNKLIVISLEAFTPGGSNPLEQKMFEKIKQISNCTNNTILIITSGSRQSIPHQFFNLQNTYIAAEDGYLYLCPEKDENSNSPEHSKKFERLIEQGLEWKKNVHTALETFCRKYGSGQISENEGSVSLIFENPELLKLLTPSLIEELVSKLEINKKMINIKESIFGLDVRYLGINKGLFLSILIDYLALVKNLTPSFVLCLGKTLEDESMFKFLRKYRLDFEEGKHYSCMMGEEPTNADYFIKTYENFYSLLEKIVDANECTEFSD